VGDAHELARELAALRNVADRVSGDERGAADHAIREERTAARREEVALVAAQGEVGEAVGSVLLHELGRSLTLLAAGGSHSLRPQPQPQGAKAERTDEEGESHLDPPRVHVGVVEAEQEARHRDRECRRDLQERDERRRIAGSDEVAARAQQRDEQQKMDGRLFEVEALREVRDRRRDHERNCELPGASLAPREAA
jgi:hypothetical protein